MGQKIRENLRIASLNPKFRFLKKRIWKAFGFKMRATVIFLNEWVQDPNFG